MLTCSECHNSIPATSRFCPHCGAVTAVGHATEEVVITSGKHLRVSQDTLSLRALQTMVESSVAWWQKEQRASSGVDREQAAAAIEQLSHILRSLSQQLAQGRETMRITTRLPTTRLYAVGCPVCGRGNRTGARFCQACGGRLLEAGNRPDSHAAMPSLRLQMAARSDTGQVRAHNEDSCLAEQIALPDGRQATLLLVADGMGGEQAGEAASRLASSTAREWLLQQQQQQQPTWDDTWHALLAECVQAANQQVYQQAGSHERYSGMGTTLTLLLVVGSRAHLAHAGDSRAYLLHAEGVADDGLPWLQLTSDHSLVARLVDIGQLDAEAARWHPQRNIIYRALGKQPTIETDTSSQPLGVGDHLLLCSDGLTAHVSDDELARITLAAPTPAHACEQLIQLANQRGGSDNISVVIAMVEGIDRHGRL